jgi:hypothetical protein
MPGTLDSEPVIKVTPEGHAHTPGLVGSEEFTSMSTSTPPEKAPDGDTTEPVHIAFAGGLVLAAVGASRANRGRRG